MKKYIWICRWQYIIYFIIAIVMMIAAGITEGLSNVNYISVTMVIFSLTLYNIFSLGDNLSVFKNTTTMGCTRKEYIKMTMLSVISRIVITGLLTYMAYLMSTGFFDSPEIDLKRPIIFKIAIGYLLTMTAINIFITAMILRFGTVVFWIIWGIFMVMSVLPSVSHRLYEQGKIDFLVRILSKIDFSSTEFYVGCIIAILVFLGLGLFSISRQDV